MAAVEISSTAPRDRRRSLKALFQLPLFPRPPCSKFSESARNLSLPEDVLREITDQMSPNDILSLSITSSHIRKLLIPKIYRTVHLRSSRSCDSGLRMLARRPDLCAHIQKLAVRPNYYLAWPTSDRLLSEEWVASTICAILPTLTHLRTFDWDGLETPRDDLWLKLRRSCPELKELVTHVGYEPLDPHSELFNFNDLTNFSLSVRHGLGDTDIFPNEELPTQLWDMLLNRCPNLTELTLCSFSGSHRLFDVNRMTDGRWPRLESVTLGAFGNNRISLPLPPPPSLPAFLAAHPTLEYLNLGWDLRRWISPDDAPKLTFPPMLDGFSGIVQQLPVGRLAYLTRLDLTCQPLHASRAAVLCDPLRMLPALTSLEVWIHMPDLRVAQEAYFSELFTSAPGLEDLHFLCTTEFGKKPLTELARALRVLPRLRTFKLTKRHSYLDENMRNSAVRVFNALAVGSEGIEAGECSRLTQVSVRWARPTCRHQLKQEGNYECMVAFPGRCVEAWERGLRAVGSSFERRYRFTLPRNVEGRWGC